MRSTRTMPPDSRKFLCSNARSIGCSRRSRSTFQARADRTVRGGGRRSIVIIDYAINLEHIGDIIERGLLTEVTKKIGHGLKFSEDGFAELQQLFQLTIDNLRIAQTILITRDVNLARQLMERKIEVRNMEKRSSERHLERLRDGRTESLQTSSLHLDILRDLKRINAHIVSVAHPIMDEQGLLGESRLITGSSTERPQ